jgi:NAD(P)-dependent dehydrogenase (short-subunit alcohol dehydrogenase family)
VASDGTQVAIVTGGAGGLGRVIAQRLRADGFRVATADLSGPDRGERDVGPDPFAFGQAEPVVLAEPVPLPVQGLAQGQFGLGVGAPDGAHVGGPSGAGRLRVLGHRQSVGPAVPPRASAALSRRSVFVESFMRISA